MIRYNQGFSTVELLITLFIAAIFILAGYTLSNAVMIDSGEVRARQRARTVAEEYIQQYKNTPGTCTPSNPVPNVGIAVDGLTSVFVDVKIECPNSVVTSVSKVTVTVTYNDPEQKIVVSSYGSQS